MQVVDAQQSDPGRAAEAPPATASTTAWFDRLASLLDELLAPHEAAGDAGDAGDAGAGGPGAGIVVSDRERALLLDLARIAAHSSERWTAPVSTYLVGVALAPHGSAVRAQVLTDLVDGLECSTS